MVIITIGAAIPVYNEEIVIGSMTVCAKAHVDEIPDLLIPILWKDADIVNGAGFIGSRIAEHFMVV